MKTITILLVILLPVLITAGEASQAFAGPANQVAIEDKNPTSKTNNTSQTAKPPIDNYDQEIIDNSSWGPSTNGFRIGLLLFPGYPHMIEPFVIVTNHIKGFYVPSRAPHGYRLEMSMVDANGRQIARTKEGDALCHEVGWLMRRSMPTYQDRGNFALPPGMPRPYDDQFNVMDCFVVEKPGIYTFRAGGALYWPGLYSPAWGDHFEIPASAVKLTITESDLETYRRKHPAP